MAKQFRVIDTQNWIQYSKAQFVASEFKINYRNLVDKLTGNKINDTRFVYGELIPVNDCRIFKSKDGIDFVFKYRFYNKNEMIWYYIVLIDSKLIKISKENGDCYLNKLIEI